MRVWRGRGKSLLLATLWVSSCLVACGGGGGDDPFGGGPVFDAGGKPGGNGGAGDGGSVFFPDPDVPVVQEDAGTALAADVRPGSADIPTEFPTDVAASPDADTTADVPPTPLVDTVDPLCGLGAVRGVVCAPSGTLQVSGASVVVEATDCDGGVVRVETTSEPNGEYLLEGLPAGTWTVEIRKASFHHEYEIEVVAGVTSDLRGNQAKLCFGASVAQIAVVDGSFDSIEAILDDLGVDYEFIYDAPPSYGGLSDATLLLEDSERLAQYDILFLNCSEWSWPNLHVQGDADIIRGNLREFVERGGSLYASDWAFAYTETAWPESVEYVGEDASALGPKVGIHATRRVRVTDPGLAAFLDKDEVWIRFDYDQWVVMEGAAEDVVVHIEGDIPEAGAFGAPVPLMVSFLPYANGGRVLFTSFHHETQITDDMTDILSYLVFEL